MALGLLCVPWVGWPGLIGLWLVAGVGQAWVNLPTQTLIAERIPLFQQGRVYGAQFAWSHLGWAVAYPLAGWMGHQWGDWAFFYAGGLSFTLLLLVQIGLPARPQSVLQAIGYWHTHEHTHDACHAHSHPGMPGNSDHHHWHYHQATIPKHSPP
jgi:MFS transporter, NRE family, putaive nickel resistance protein